jgi:hypothetical protein
VLAATYKRALLDRYKPSFEAGLYKLNPV